MRFIVLVGLVYLVHASSSAKPGPSSIVPKESGFELTDPVEDSEGSYFLLRDSEKAHKITVSTVKAKKSIGSLADAIRRKIKGDPYEDYPVPKLTTEGWQAIPLDATISVDIPTGQIAFAETIKLKIPCQCCPMPSSLQFYPLADSLMPIHAGQAVHYNDRELRASSRIVSPYLTNEKINYTYNYDIIGGAGIKDFASYGIKPRCQFENGFFRVRRIPRPVSLRHPQYPDLHILPMHLPPAAITKLLKAMSTEALSFRLVRIRELMTESSNQGFHAKGLRVAPANLEESLMKHLQTVYSSSISDSRHPTLLWMRGEEKHDIVLFDASYTKSNSSYFELYPGSEESGESQLKQGYIRALIDVTDDYTADAAVGAFPLVRVIIK